MAFAVAEFVAQLVGFKIAAELLGLVSVTETGREFGLGFDLWVLDAVMAASYVTCAC